MIQNHCQREIAFHTDKKCILDLTQPSKSHFLHQCKAFYIWNVDNITYRSSTQSNQEIGMSLTLARLGSTNPKILLKQCNITLWVKFISFSRKALLKPHTIKGILHIICRFMPIFSGTNMRLCSDVQPIL